MESLMRGSALLVAVLLTACNSTPYYRDKAAYDRDYQHAVSDDDGQAQGATADAEAAERALKSGERAAAQQYRNLVGSRERQAYRDGVRDTLEDFRGKMQARQGFVWEPPVVDYVEVPGGVRNGAYVPAHREAVIVSPGRWVEANAVDLPQAAE